MNAQELTEKYYKDHQDIYELKKQVDYLTQEFEKQRLLIEDMQIDIKMLENMKRK